MHVSEDPQNSEAVSDAADKNSAGAGDENLAGECLAVPPDFPGDISSKVIKGGDHAVTAERIAMIEQDIVANLAGPFLKSVGDELPEMEELLSEFSVGDSRDGKVVLAFRRHIHDLRGMGATFGYPLVTEIANQIHGIIHHFPSTTPEQIDAVRVHVDAFKLVVTEDLEGGGGERGYEIMDGLRKVFSKITTSTTPPASFA